MTEPDRRERMTSGITSYAGVFERKLIGIIDRSETEEEEQSMLLMLLVREIHTMKLILWWVLIIVPIVVMVFAILNGVHAAPTSGSTP